jgi:regulator of protease activity HflC (stomatin/prohibitin superfamily)
MAGWPETEDQMSRVSPIPLVALVVCQLALLGCSGDKAGEQVEAEISEEALQAAAREQVLQATLTEVRLGDGVPLDLDVSVRWRATSPQQLLEQFASVEDYAQMILEPKSREAAARVANTFPHVLEVFTESRDSFSEQLRTALLEGLKGDEIGIVGVVIPEIGFPEDFTQAMEQVAKNEQHLELIRQQKILDLEKANAAKDKARAEGEVEIAQAEARGRVEEINAQTEEKRRLTTLAKAETEAQVVERNAKAEAERQRLMAATEAEKRRLMDLADADKQRKLAEVEAEKKRLLDQVEDERQRKANQAEIEKEAELLRVELESKQKLAAIFAANPSYAQFLVSQELASKIQIAVLPVGTDNNVLTSLLQTSMILPESGQATKTSRKDRR